VSKNWTVCGNKTEEHMATTRAVVAETNKTWEHGKLKLTLTRKSASGLENTKPNRGAVDMVTVINKDGETRGQGSQGFMWSGSASDFKEFVGSLGGLHSAVDAELFGARSADGCGCPTQHAMDCDK
jgi:hypothetical protein